MVVVDFSNPFLRIYLARQYATSHIGRLCGIAASVEQCASSSIGMEAFASGGVPARELAAVVDIDEVLLANIHTSTGDPISTDGLPYDCWQLTDKFYACDYYTGPDGLPWPRDETRLNPLLPGAVVLLSALVKSGMMPILLTGRAESLRRETVENLVYVGLASDDGKNTPFVTAELLDPSARRLIMCDDASLPGPGESIRPFKESQRKEISTKYRISMNVGDQLSDLGAYADFNYLVENVFYRTE